MSPSKIISGVLTCFNLVLGVACSFYVFGSAFSCTDLGEVWMKYLILGVLTPLVVCFLSGWLQASLEGKVVWQFILVNSVAFASIYLLIGIPGLPEALAKKNFTLLIWAGATLVVSSVAGATGALIAMNRSGIKG